MGGKSNAEDMKLRLIIPGLRHWTEVITFDVIEKNELQRPFKYDGCTQSPSTVSGFQGQPSGARQLDEPR